MKTDVNALMRVMINEPNFWKVPRLAQQFILDPVQADVNDLEYFYDVWELFLQLGLEICRAASIDVCSLSFLRERARGWVYLARR